MANPNAPVWIAAKRFDIFADPFQCHRLIFKPKVAGAIVRFGGQKTQRPEAVFDVYQHDVVIHHILRGKLEADARRALEAATVYPHHDWQIFVGFVVLKSNETRKKSENYDENGLMRAGLH